MVNLNLDLPKLRSFQDEARQLGGDTGEVTQDLEDRELQRFGRSYTRQFIRELPNRQMVDIHFRHIKEGLLGGMIAKAQLKAEIDNEIPASGKVGGPLAIRACWFGIGDDWEDLGSINGTAAARGAGAWTCGAAQDWIHSGTTLMGGADGNAIRVGENAVHVIYGMGSIHASPKLESVQFTVNGKQKPLLYCGFAQKMGLGHTQRIKEFDNAFVWKKDTEILGEVFFSGAFGATVTDVVDFPVLYGVSFIKEPALRVLDPVTGPLRILPGVRYDIVHTT